MSSVCTTQKFMCNSQNKIIHKRRNVLKTWLNIIRPNICLCSVWKFPKDATDSIINLPKGVRNKIYAPFDDSLLINIVS